MTNESMLLWGLIFSSIGIGYFIYGRRQSQVVARYCGIALMIYPYFVPNLLSLIGVGIALLALPLLWRRLGTD